MRDNFVRVVVVSILIQNVELLCRSVLLEELARDFPLSGEDDAILS